jgi:hypothetical protein
VDGGRADLVEIPESLLDYLLPGTMLEAQLHATGKRWRGDSGECGTYTLSGSQVADLKALEQMNILSTSRVLRSESCERTPRVRLLQGPDFEDLFRTLEHSAFHLEVEDAYHTPHESGPFQSS